MTMPSSKLCKTIHQYSKEPLSQEDMQKLCEIAEDYCKVKNYVYQRYGGIRSLSKLYPGYTIQNEMTESGLRGKLGLPSVYFYLAIFDALGDIKTQWTKTKTAVLKQINKKEELTQEEKHYLRFVIKIDSCFDNILCGRKMKIPEEMESKYAEILGCVTDVERLNRYLCRQVRNKLQKLHTDKAEGFAIAERAYRYGRNSKEEDKGYGIYISTKESRRRVFIPLTDTNAYKKQMYVKLSKENNTVEIAIPKEMEAMHHEAYTNELGLSMGIYQMFTTHEGHVYGEKLGELHDEFTEFVSNANKTYRREKQNNPGRKKYQNKKRKLEAGLHDYINQELNRLIEIEKPKIVYIPKLPRSTSSGVNKRINYSLNIWQKGYIRKRLEQKCKENSIEIAEVIGKNISRECSKCGSEGTYVKDIFYCEKCSYEADKKLNAARNALQRGKTDGRLNMTYVSCDAD